MKLHPAMTTPSVQRLFKALGAGSVRFVGGCVRNMLLGEPIGDIDLATSMTPDQVIRILSSAKIKYIPTGLAHGTVTAIIDGTGYEITTLRRDIKTDGRRAVIAYTDDWAEDAARRDFTINAIYADDEGNIYDPLMSGLDDLNHRKIKFVGDAATRIQEDYLRILRFFRFQSLYGKGKADKKAVSACAQFAPKIKTLSRERVTQEFTKIVMGDAPQKILAVMQNYKIIPDILGKDFNPDRIGSMIKIQKKAEGATKDILLCTRLLGVMDFQFQKITILSNLLIINKKQKSILDEIPKIKIDMKRIETSNIQELLYKFSWNSVAAALIVFAVKENISPIKFKKIWDLFLNTKRPVFKISGQDIISLGFAQGPDVGKMLKQLEQKWIRSGFTLTPKDLMKQE